MSFFKKRSVAVICCLLMVVLAFRIGRIKQPEQTYVPENLSSSIHWGSENYGSYLRFISDETKALNEQTLRDIAQINASLDYSYGSICGLGILDDLSGRDVEDAAFELADDLGLGEQDYFLLLDLGDRNWYFAAGSEAQRYINHELEILVTSYMDDLLEDPDDTIVEMYEDLRDWYQDNVPISGEHASSTATNDGSGIGLFFILVFLIFVISIFSSINRVRRRVNRTVFYRPVVPFFMPGFHIHRRRPGPDFHGSAGFHNHASSKFRGSSGGFGSDRGSFRGGSGFGGGSRGGRGGFGGKR